MLFRFVTDGTNATEGRTSCATFIQMLKQCLLQAKMLRDRRSKRWLEVPLFDRIMLNLCHLNKTKHPKMKKLIWSMAAATLMLTALVSCKGGSGDPKSVAESFMDAIKKKDFDGAAKYATKDSKSALEMMKSAMKMAEAFGGKSEDMDIDKEWKGKKVTYGEPKIEGDNATVSLMVDGKEEMPISLKKEDGSWKVAFDKNTLMKSNADKMKDSTDDTMKDLNISADSLKKAMEEVGPAMDSVKKMMEQK